MKNEEVRTGKFTRTTCLLIEYCPQLGILLLPQQRCVEQGHTEGAWEVWGHAMLTRRVKGATLLNAAADGVLGTESSLIGRIQAVVRRRWRVWQIALLDTARQAVAHAPPG